MKERKPLAVGDRVRVFGWVQMHHTPYQPRAGGDATVRWVSNGHTHVVFDRMPNGSDRDETSYSVHPNQCRRLVRKPKPRKWTAEDIEIAWGRTFEQWASKNGGSSDWSMSSQARAFRKALGITND